MEYTQTEATAGSKSGKKRTSRKELTARKKQKQQNHSVASSQSCESAKCLQLVTPAVATYIPTPLPNLATIQANRSKMGKSLGNWFPKASVIKSPVSYTNADKFDGQSFQPKASLILFYQYVEPLWPESKLEQLIAYLTKIAEQRILGGRIRVAREGVNATLSSVDTLDCSAKQSLEFFCRDLREQFDDVFKNTDFKFIDDLTPDRHFAQLKIFPVQELVFYGLNGKEDAPLGKGGVHLKPKDFHEMLSRGKDDTVVIDVRNHYEAVIGRFDGQERKSEKGATYIDPKMRKSTDFTSWLEQKDTQRTLEGKNVMMYCTGGVRCERASAVLNKKLGDKVKGVFQLEGGIEAYLKEFRDGGHWRGKNFVFDKREAVSADDHNGDGGVIKRTSVKDEEKARCCVCNKPWDRYVGKKKCSTCGVPVLMCDSCMSRKSQADELIRCPLCVEQNVTVRAAEIELTENGIKGKAPEQRSGKAAPSVLKWGGGHAASKKNRRRFASVPCTFGADCKRADCFFAHPTRTPTSRINRQI